MMPARVCAGERYRKMEGGTLTATSDDMDHDSAPPRTTINGLIGVYNANSTLRGELAYLIGARLGHAHCSLCDITHRGVRERREWKRCRVGLAVPFVTYHRNDQPPEVRTIAADQAPAVIADTDRGRVLLLGPEDIDACDGSPQGFLDALNSAAAARGLSWPATDDCQHQA